MYAHNIGRRTEKSWSYVTFVSKLDKLKFYYGVFEDNALNEMLDNFTIDESASPDCRWHIGTLLHNALYKRSFEPGENEDYGFYGDFRKGSIIKFSPLYFGITQTTTLMRIKIPYLSGMTMSKKETRAAISYLVKEGHPSHLLPFVDRLIASHPRFNWEHTFIGMLSRISESDALTLLARGLLCNRTIKLLNLQSMFDSAATRGYRELMDKLLQINPQILQCGWLVRGQVPGDLQKHRDYVAELQERRKQPLSLKEVAILAVRSLFKRDVDISDLPLALRYEVQQCVCDCVPFPLPAPEY